jgi:2-methylcitrate dehydratase PrpD
MLPDVRPARVQVKLKNGSKLTETVERPPGGFDNPYSEEDLLKKFRRLAGMALTERAIADVEKMVATLPDLEDVALLSPLLQGGLQETQWK